jgi:hypothetical protein
MHDDGRDLFVDVHDVDVDLPLFGVTTLPLSCRRRVNHLPRAVGRQAESVVRERSLGQAGVKRPLHARRVAVEPPLEVVEDRALDLSFVVRQRTSAIRAAARAAPSVSTGR